MQDWSHKIASIAKEKNLKIKQQTIETATAFIGTLDSVEPLKVSIMNGAIQYDAEDIFVTKAFEDYEKKFKVVGADVLALPIDGLEAVCLVDLIK